MALAVAPYRPRHTLESPLYGGALLDHHERFAAVYDDVYAARYGAWRPVVADTFRRLRLHVAPRIEVQNWILSFGEHVRVVEPRELVERITTRLEAARRGYGATPSQENTDR